MEWLVTVAVPVLDTLAALLSRVDFAALFAFIALASIVAFGLRITRKIDELDIAVSEIRSIGISSNRLEALQELREILTVSTATTRLLERLEAELGDVREIRDGNLAVAQDIRDLLQELRDLRRDHGLNPGGSHEFTPVRAEDLARIHDDQASVARAIDRMQREIDAIAGRRLPPGETPDAGEEEDSARRQAREALAAFVRDGNDQI